MYNGDQMKDSQNSSLLMDKKYLYQNEKLSKHFWRSEFACNGLNCCNNSAPINPQLIHLLEQFRDDRGGMPININSGFRCIKHNRSIGSMDTSQHPKGNACDISGDGCNINFMAEIARKYFSKVIVYDWGIHVDVR